MTWPPEYQRASIDFERFMVAARDGASLATTNMAWNMVVGVLLAIRRRLEVDQALRFSDLLPPAVRALFLENWHPPESFKTNASAAELLDEVRSVRSEHNFSPDNAFQAVGYALREVMPADSFDSAIALLPHEIKAALAGSAS